MDRRVFIWRDVDDWYSEVRTAYADLIGTQCADEIRQYAPQHPIIDNLTWLDRILAKGGQQAADTLVASMRDWFTTRYTSIRAYHGCRSDDLTSYTRYGLIPFDAARYQRAAQHCFLTTQPAQNREILKHFTEIMAIQSRLLYAGAIGFHVDDRFITECTTYYLIYGSHSLLATAVMLSRRTGHDFKRVLANIGQPTVFVCDIPLSNLTLANLNNLCKTLLAGVVQEGSLRITGLDIAVNAALPPHYIVDQFHPQQVNDVLYDNHIRD